MSVHNDDDEFFDRDKIRCPKCGFIRTIRNGDSDELFGDGEHTVCCWECEHDFEISTHLSFIFTSPKRIAL